MGRYSRQLRLPGRIVLLALALGACSGPVQRAEESAAQDEWMKAVLEYRAALAKNPRDVEYKSRLQQTELKAADYYYQRGQRLLAQDNLDGAIVQFQQGLVAMPEHSKLQQAMGDALARKEADGSYNEGLAQLNAGNTQEARRLFEKALASFPSHKLSAARLAELHKAQEDRASAGLALSSKAPVTLNFRQTELRTAFEFLAKSFGVNMIFDEAFKSAPVTLFAKDVTFEQGLNLLLTTSKTFYKKIGPNTILVAPDSKEKRGQYEDHMVRSFHLNTVGAKEMADILKNLLTIKKLSVNEELNSIIIRDTDAILRQAERLIELSDRKPAEMLLEVEILEVNRNKAERLGLDLGSYAVSAAVPSFPLTGSLRRAADSGTLTIPSATFRFFKQDVDAKTLANPKIRVVNGKEAKIHIGDRVPLRAATIQDATGQVRTTFDYREIGIRLLVLPAIHLDNSATVKLSLEVSSLGENVGTVNEPAFRIGTRNAETVMLLRDGETAILGGLIRDEERSTQVKVPGLGSIPLIGGLFKSHDNSGGRTDVLLTIAPRVVRGWEQAAAHEFYSGSESTYGSEPLFAYLNDDAAAASKPRIDTSGTAVAEAAPALASAAAAALASALPAMPAAVLLAFGEALYEAQSGQEFEIRLRGQNLAGAGSLPVEILYNPQLLAYVRGDKTDPALQSFRAEADPASGVLRLNLEYPSGSAAAGDVELARIQLRGLKPGVSYLVCRVPTLRKATGEVINAQVRASRVLVK